MLRSIELHNFLTFKEAKVQFGPGINMITGSMLVGKGHLMKAIRLPSVLVPKSKTDVWGLSVLEAYGGYDALYHWGTVTAVGEPPPPMRITWVWDAVVVNRLSTESPPHGKAGGQLAWEIKLEPDLHGKLVLKETVRILPSLQQDGRTLMVSDGRGNILLPDLEDFGQGALSSRTPLLAEGWQLADTRLVSVLAVLADHPAYALLNALRKAIQMQTHFKDWQMDNQGPIRTGGLDYPQDALLADGRNLEALLYGLRFKGLSQSSQINHQLAALSPLMPAFRFEYPNGMPALYFEEKGLDRLVSLRQVSKGLLQWLLLTAALRLSHQNRTLISFDNWDSFVDTGQIPELIQMLYSSQSQVFFMSRSHVFRQHLQELEVVELKRTPELGTHQANNIPFHQQPIGAEANTGPADFSPASN